MTTQDQLVIEYFSDSETYARRYQDSSSTAYFFSTRLRQVFILLKDLAGKRGLDVGCGPGMTAHDIINRGCEFYGIDLSQQMLNECKRNSGPFSPVHLAAAKMEQMPFPNALFDAVLCLGALEYTDDAQGVMQELARVVKENGIVIISMLNKASPYRFWLHYIYRSYCLNLVRRALKRPVTTEPALRLLTEQQCRTLLFDNHLQVTDVVYYDFNLWLTPLDRYFPKLALRTAHILEGLSRSRLRWLGTGFIIKARKAPCNHADRTTLVYFTEVLPRSVSVEKTIRVQQEVAI